MFSQHRKGTIIAVDLLLLLLETHPCPRTQQRHNNNQHVVSYPLSAGPGQTAKRNRENGKGILFCENYCVNPLVTR